MRQLQKDLVQACRTKNITWRDKQKRWYAVKEYASQFKKYDDLTLREIDQVVAEITKN